jgi:DNA helicase-2/ATP-dependent DNA helicase PcrA
LQEINENRLNTTKPPRPTHEAPNNTGNYNYLKKNAVNRPVFAPPPPITNAANADGFNVMLHVEVGETVEHQRFGTGKVIATEGTAADRRATIFFAGVGQKNLVLKFAKLKKI